LIDGDGSFSIDQQRYNFQFGGDAFWQIKGGKKAGMLSRVAYQAKTSDFWRSCNGIAGPAYWQQFGSFFGSSPKSVIEGEAPEMHEVAGGV